MKKRFIVVGLIVFIWLLKMNYDQIQSDTQLQSLQTQLTQLEQNNANLNDQLVALQRQSTAVPEQNSSTTAANVQPQVVQHSVLLVKQQLQLVQFALQQQQEIYAFEQLTQLQKQVPNYDIAPALQQSLEQGISKDLALIQQYHDLRQAQRDQANLLFKTLDQQLNRLSQSPDRSYQKTTNAHFWNNWFKVESVAQPKTELMNQHLVIKEIQIRLLLAKQAFDAGLTDEYQQSLKQASALFSQAPALQQPSVRASLDKAKQLPIPPIPTLSTLALLN
ncbi:hypothetical protein [Acinetobacter sp. MD2(2019)]|uniref:hypothetical protein n=1 Tax=Acinetobacter sp. MD2(2019) TaxID=2605273 RepID=UPI002D1E937C|nr:hypothetical protein [Acinetobacter sp. MD2(2019)]MEB3754461.1 hypothetical protein [Acinetobacter sp. MD2(2019)]